MTKQNTCPECGAIRENDAEHCVLCGFTFQSKESGNAVVPSANLSNRESNNASCQRCDHANPTGSKYCNRCGEKIAVSTPQSLGLESSDKSAEDSGMRKQVGMLLGTSVFLVLALLAISVWSDGRFRPQAQETTAQTESQAITAGNITLSPLPGNQQASLDSLNNLIDGSADANQRLALMKESVDLMVNNGRYDYAGIGQEQIAAEMKDVESWGRAGTFFLTWMDRQPGGEERTSWARRAVSAFQSALDIDPNDLDVRTDMAFAYLNDPENPMEAIQQTNRVLEADSLHPQANFNRGLMLAQINRRDQAVTQFQKVLRISEPGTLIHDRAGDILSELQSR